MPCSASNKQDSADARKDSLERALKPAASVVAAIHRQWLAGLPRSRKFSLWTDERLVIGLANGVIENAGLDLHRFFGTPVISGSKLKGIAADAGRELVRDGQLTDEDRLAIFGDAKDAGATISPAGCIAFLAAHPDRPDCRIELDVLTVHYPQYYSHGGTDEDTDNPNPSLFPVVAEGQEFIFHLLCPAARVTDADAARLLDAAAACLRHALIHHGVGGKTRAGYGRFRDSEVRVIPKDTADELFAPVSTAVSSSPPPVGNVTPPVASSVDSFVAHWSGDALRPNEIKKFADALRKLPSERRLAAFDACVPMARRTFSDKLWAAFKSRNHGIKLLKELNLD
jgi:CRISPR type III-B/RAMP module RAMP protein Cmr6